MVMVMIMALPMTVPVVATATEQLTELWWCQGADSATEGAVEGVMGALPVQLIMLPRWQRTVKLACR
jgi:hypothetical protein